MEERTDTHRARGESDTNAAPSPVNDQPPPVNDLWFAQGEMRAIWKVSVYGVITFFLLFFVGAAVFVIVPDLDWRFVNPVLLGGAAITASLVCTRLIDRRPLVDVLALRWHRAAAWQLGMGMVISLLMILVLLGMELAFGGARMLPGHVTISHTLSLLFLGLVAFILVGFAEEILVRGYPFTILQGQGGLVTALVLTSGAFSLIHVFNPGVGWFAFLNIFLAGIWLGVARVVSGSLWLPVGLHIGWNFFLGPVFGFPVSGIVERSVWIVRSDGPAWINGGLFGPEGGVLASLVLIGGTLAFTLPPLRRAVSRIESPEVRETPEVRGDARRQEAATMPDKTGSAANGHKSEH
ncbi:MAG: type II CAAX endopeptidase family protein [Bacteroidota bacterium]|nr:type II CAAX endopeptidase family protein [Bacteroidota bacterium]